MGRESNSEAIELRTQDDAPERDGGACAEGEGDQAEGDHDAAHLGQRLADELVVVFPITRSCGSTPPL